METYDENPPKNELVTGHSLLPAISMFNIALLNLLAML